MYPVPARLVCLAQGTFSLHSLPQGHEEVDARTRCDLCDTGIVQEFSGMNVCDTCPSGWEDITER